MCESDKIRNQLNLGLYPTQKRIVIFELPVEEIENGKNKGVKILMGTYSPTIQNQIWFHYVKVTISRGIFNYSDNKHIDLKQISKIESIQGKDDMFTIFVNGKPEMYKTGNEKLRNMFVWTLYQLAQKYSTPFDASGFDIGAINVLARVGGFAQKCPLLVTEGQNGLSILQSQEENDDEMQRLYISTSMLASDSEIMNLELYFNSDEFRGLSTQSTRKQLDAIVASDEDMIYNKLVEWEQDRDGPVTEITKQLDKLDNQLDIMYQWLDSKSEHYIKMKQGLNIISSQNYAIQYQIENQRKLCEELTV